MKTKTLNDVEYGFVEVPERTGKYCIQKYPISGAWVMQSDFKGLNAPKWKLPSGTWQIIGIAAELKEEEWETVVEVIALNPSFCVNRKIYYNYEFNEQFLEVTLRSSIESGSSLIASLSMQKETTLILLKQK